MLARRPRCSAGRQGNTFAAIDADDVPAGAPVEFGDQVAADHLTKNADEGVDAEIPINTVAVVMLDRATQWIAACPKASKTAARAGCSRSRVQAEMCNGHPRAATD